MEKTREAGKNPFMPRKLLDLRMAIRLIAPGMWIF